MKKILIWLLCACMLGGTALAQGEETLILLGEDAILVDGAPISTDAEQAVYLENKTETHDDVPEDCRDVVNRVVTITEGGSYRISGSAQDVQLAVRAGSDDAVRIILDGAALSCRTAPAVAVYSAAEPAVPGEYAVTIELAAGSENSIDGAQGETGDEEKISLSGAVSSLVSLGFEGEGALDVSGVNEGIEVKFGHMSFNGGSIRVISGDDPLNASEDEVAVITVNSGSLLLQVRPDENGEGDGMDSNGAIVINGGTVESFAHPASMDSGIDTDLGCTINGGVVMSAGNMYDAVSADSTQIFMVLQFLQPTDEMIVALDADGKPAMVFDPQQAYGCIVLSSPELLEGDYTLWRGGELTEENGETIYSGGTQLQHGGNAGRGWQGDMPGRPDGRGRQGNMDGRPGGRARQGNMDGIPDGRGRQGNMAGMTDDMQPPQAGGRGGFRQGNNGGEVSTVFHLAPGGALFSCVTAVE